MKFLLLAKYFILQKAGNIIRTSNIFITEPWGKTGRTAYLNHALEIKTDKSPLQLLKIFLKIEKNLGRTNKNTYSDRTIDIDILFYDETILESKNLIIPHPRLHLRNFTLQPLLELNASYKHPIFKKSIEELAKDCEDTGKVSIFKPEK